MVEEILVERIVFGEDFGTCVACLDIDQLVAEVMDQAGGNRKPKSRGSGGRTFAYHCTALQQNLNSLCVLLRKSCASRTAIVSQTYYDFPILSRSVCPASLSVSLALLPRLSKFTDVCHPPLPPKKRTPAAREKLAVNTLQTKNSAALIHHRNHWLLVSVYGAISEKTLENTTYIHFHHFTTAAELSCQLPASNSNLHDGR